MIRVVLLILAVWPSFGRAEVPLVVTDIAPIHSLVGLVMDGVGNPELLIPPGADPHHFALRPSDAAMLGQATLVIWAGPALTPWLADPLATLAPQATQIALLQTPGWTPLPLADTQGHDHGDIDPHAWLDPTIATVWLAHIRDALGAADPENAALYTTNAASATARLSDLSTRINTTLAPLRGRGYLLPHMAYGYFEAHFAVPSAGAVTTTDAAAPGPATLAALRDMVTTGAVVCVLHGPANSDWSQMLTDGTNARTGTIDDVGAGLEPGPELYEAMMLAIADSLAACLS